jgi:hypothetical protein
MANPLTNDLTQIPTIIGSIGSATGPANHEGGGKVRTRMTMAMNVDVGAPIFQSVEE